MHAFAIRARLISILIIGKQKASFIRGYGLWGCILKVSVVDLEEGGGGTCMDEEDEEVGGGSWCGWWAVWFVAIPLLVTVMLLIVPIPLLWLLMELEFGTGILDLLFRLPSDSGW